MPDPNSPTPKNFSPPPGLKFTNGWLRRLKSMRRVCSKTARRR